MPDPRCAVSRGTQDVFPQLNLVLEQPRFESLSVLGMIPAQRE